MLPPDWTLKMLFTFSVRCSGPSKDLAVVSKSLLNEKYSAYWLPVIDLLLRSSKEKAHLCLHCPRTSDSNTPSSRDPFPFYYSFYKPEYDTVPFPISFSWGQNEKPSLSSVSSDTCSGLSLYHGSSFLKLLWSLFAALSQLIQDIFPSPLL